MIGRSGCLVLAVAVGVLVRTAEAQDRGLRDELRARGAPAAFVDPVAAQVESARSAGLPAGPMIDKALEGWAKGVTEQRVVTALQQVRTRLESARGLLIAAGEDTPADALVTGAAEAMARGLSSDDVRALVVDAPGPEAAAAGLMVAASLHAQGLERGATVRAILDAYARDADAAQLFELPSVVADLTGHGIEMRDLARRIMQGGGLPLPPMAGSAPGTARPAQVPPTPGGKQQGTGRQQRRQ